MLHNRIDRLLIPKSVGVETKSTSHKVDIKEVSCNDTNCRKMKYGRDEGSRVVLFLNESLFSNKKQD